MGTDNKVMIETRAKTGVGVEGRGSGDHNFECSLLIAVCCLWLVELVRLYGYCDCVDEVLWWPCGYCCVVNGVLMTLLIDDDGC